CDEMASNDETLLIDGGWDASRRKRSGLYAATWTMAECPISEAGVDQSRRERTAAQKTGPFIELGVTTNAPSGDQLRLGG
ncbi:hypothetical protein B8W95_13265, partial [Staphylococcus pasteuri]